MSQQIFSMAETAQILDMGKINLFRWLRAQHVFDQHNRPRPPYTGKGYFEVHTQYWTHETLGERASTKTYVTTKGLKLLERLRNQKAA